MKMLTYLRSVFVSVFPNVLDRQISMVEEEAGLGVQRGLEILKNIYISVI